MRGLKSLTIVERLKSLLRNERIDWHAVIVLLYIPLALTVLEYCGLPYHIRVFFPGMAAKLSPSIVGLLGVIHWSCMCCLAYLIIPALIIKCVFHKRIADFGLSAKGMGKHIRLYGILYVALIPMIVFASLRPGFQATYPFFKPYHGEWALLLLGELFYLGQFFYLEFFFRGFVFFTLEKTFGFHSVFIMTIPYCMIHYHKPMPEALAAVVAGVILGTLAWRTRSIWCGVLIHVSVALSMDLLSLLQQGLLVRIFTG